MWELMGNKTGGGKNSKATKLQKPPRSVCEVWGTSHTYRPLVTVVAIFFLARRDASMLAATPHRSWYRIPDHFQIIEGGLARGFCIDRHTERR